MKQGERQSLTGRQILFVEHLAAGKPISTAYREAGYKCAAGGESSNGCKLLRIPHVKAKLEELRSANAARTAITRDRIIGWLTDALLTPPGEVDENHPLCQKVTRYYRGGEVSRITTEMVSKVRVLQILTRMLGWDGPEKEGFDSHQAWKEMLHSWGPQSVLPTHDLDGQPIPGTGLPGDTRPVDTTHIPCSWSATLPPLHPSPPSEPERSSRVVHSPAPPVPGTEAPAEQPHMKQPVVLPASESSPPSGPPPRIPTGLPIAHERGGLTHPDDDDDPSQPPGGSFVETPGPMPWDHPRPFPGAFDHLEVKAVGGPASFRLSDGRRLGKD